MRPCNRVPRLQSKIDQRCPRRPRTEAYVLASRVLAVPVLCPLLWSVLVFSGVRSTSGRQQLDAPAKLTLSGERALSYYEIQLLKCRERTKHQSLKKHQNVLKDPDENLKDLKDGGGGDRLWWARIKPKGPKDFSVHQSSNSSNRRRGVLTSVHWGKPLHDHISPLSPLVSN